MVASCPGENAVPLFSEVDRTADPDFFVRFLAEGNALPTIRTAKPIILDGLRLSGGERVLDVGCGTGEDVLDILQRVGPTGTVVGVDLSETMITAARRRLAREARARFEVGDAHALPFASGEFDAVRMERVLMHLAYVDVAIREMVRVLKPGGRISVFDFDWDTVIVDSPYRETTRTIVHAFCDGVRNGWIGRQLHRRFREQGLIELTVTPHQIFIHREFAQLLLGGFLTAAQKNKLLEPVEVEAWWRDLEAADRADTFLIGFTALIAAGRKPER